MRAALLAAGALITSLTTAPQFAAARWSVTFPDGTALTLPAADTPETRQRGLMFKAALAANEGMLFIFEEPGFYPFWMQNCLIPLDILWVDEKSAIVSMAESVPPCRVRGCEPPCASSDCPVYPPVAGSKAKYVVEVPAGFAAAHKLKTGQKLKLAKR